MNRYEVLGNTDDAVAPNSDRSIKPPPIFIDRVGNIQLLIKLLNNCASNDYVLKELCENQVQV